MNACLKKIILIIASLLLLIDLKGQKADLSGEAAGWATSNYKDGFALQTGLRYIPQLSLNLPMKNKLSLDGEFSADAYLNYTMLSDTANIFDAKVAFYRFWLRLSGDRFEIRAGLQKINFGSASMLRPLMWFDRIDPRDPLKLTKGVYGLQGKYFFKNNANIWLWVLYGNKDTKGWETLPSVSGRPEIGGRVQLPIPKGEIAFSYHNRKAEFPEDWQPPVTGSRTFPENRFGLDFKLDLGVGLWFEGTVTHQKQDESPPFTKAITLGADYTIGIGNGLNINAEHMFYNSSERLFTNGTGLSFTGISASIPLSIITRISAILFYDWKNNGFYRFANCSFTFDNIAINLIGFWNPENFSIFNYNSGPNMFSGAGGQVMVVYNY
jgi:hypothetical protein